jgi:probable HAF family extracellular repeat protein
VDTLGTHGFVYSGGTFNNFDDPSAEAGGTNAFQINASGQVVGYYYDTTSSHSAHGFVYSGGTYTTFDDPSARVGGPFQGTFAYGINASGQIVGNFVFPNSDNAGFLDSGGSFTTLEDPQGYAGGIGTAAAGINSTGQIVGAYPDSSGLHHGFLYVGGNFTNFDDPLGAQGTSATGITDAGQIVGTYVDASGVDHGFLYDGSTFTTLDDPLGTKGTAILGVNNVGQVVGEYFDSSGNEHGFVAALTTGPTALDQDSGEQAALSLAVNGGQPIGAATASAVPFTVGGIESDDSGTVSFSDGSHPAVVVTITNGVLAATTANLAGLNDGPITATLHLNNDAAGNSFTNVITNATLDRDSGEQTALSLAVNGGHPIGAATAGAVPFTVGGIESDDSGTVSFSDGSHPAVVVNISNGAPAATTANLAGLNDGTITATLHLNKDAAGNSFTNVITNATLDRDSGEQAALKLTVNGGQPIGAAKASAVPFTVAGLETDDSGSVSFSDGSHTPVAVAIANGVLAATTANLAGLNDGPITATLHLNNDAAGNSFTNVITNATLDQDKGTEVPKVSAPAKLTVPAGGSQPLGIVLTADSDDTLSVSISGVPTFESISAAGATPSVTKQGATNTYTFNALPAADWNNGLVVHSTYAGKGHPMNTLTVTASNTTAGESATASSVSIAVTDPPISASPNGSTNLSDLIAQFSAGIGSSRSDAGPTLGLFGGGLLASGSIPDIATLTEHFMGAPFVSLPGSALLPGSLTTAEEQKALLALHQG